MERVNLCDSLGGRFTRTAILDLNFRVLRSKLLPILCKLDQDMPSTYRGKTFAQSGSPQYLLQSTSRQFPESSYPALIARKFASCAVLL